MSVLFLPNFCF
uniref:Uncharacterized protein n=1 Tax=Rhizophora mucronata TaxID=61149 RepID=A0A2P2PDP9_RHIMU